MKRAIYVVLTVVAIVCAVVAPYGVPVTIEKRNTLQTAATEYTMARNQLGTAKLNLADAENAFNSSRTFEIAYGDVSRLVQVLNNVAAITVSAVNIADPAQNFATGATWDAASETEVKAITMSLTVDDTASALLIIDRMELPLYSISVTEPNIVNITFLTGGGVGE